MKRCIFCLSECRDDEMICPRCGYDGKAVGERKNSLPLGTRLGGGRYVLGGVFSAGKVFITYHAFDTKTRQRVRISEYMPERLAFRYPGELFIKFNDENCRTRADREIAAFFAHYSRLCEVAKESVLDFTDCFGENSTVYYVCSVSEGVPLSSLIGNGKAMPFSKAVALLKPVVECAEKLELAGKWHGSITPYSIITENGKVTKLTGCFYPPQSTSSPFDAPEKKLGAKGCGAYTDVYSIGAILYEMSTGLLPANAEELSRRGVLRFPQSVSEQERAVIVNSMALNKEDRFSGVHELAQALGMRKSAEIKKGKTSASEVIRKMVLALAITCLIVSGGILLNYYVIEPFKESKLANELESMVAASIPADKDPWEEIRKKYPDIDFPQGMNPSFAELYASNQELAGWVSIPEIGLSHPVVQTDDNSKYLRRDIYGKSTAYGVPFFDYHNNLLELNRNTIIFGHNMRHDDRIFGVLEQYRDIETFKKAPIIKVDTLFDSYEFKIYAVFITNSLPEDDNGKVFNYIFTDASSSRFMDYVAEIDKRKLYSTGVDINENDKLITLSTCCYDFEDARLAVVGRLVRANESTQIDASLAAANPNPKYPQAWYDVKRMNNPYAADIEAF